VGAIQRRLVNQLRVRGMQQGVLGGNRRWLAVWVGITAAKQVHKRLGREPELVDRVVLKPGQRVVIEDTAIEWGKVGRGGGGPRRGTR
jgi:hypothetical protein